MKHLKRKRQTTLSATTLAVYLSLNVEVMDDQRGMDCLALPLLSLTWLLMAGWWVQLRWADVQRRFTYWRQQWYLVRSVAGIGWRSVAWSMGL
ncbi:hypothetical protein ACFLXQ_05115 [Chloroflexota bacterium]